MGNIFLRKVPEDLHRRYKAACAQKGISMHKDFIEHMEKVVESEKENSDNLRKAAQGETNNDI